MFACGVDGVGPPDLGALIESFPPYWSSRRKRWITRMGDVVADSALNRRLSPLYHLDTLRAPLLIGHGANDPRVKLVHSETIVKAMRAKGLDVTFIVYPDEGHGFGRMENNRDFYGRAEDFFAKHLGGRVEAWKAVPGSTAQVR
jgi:dipeptidyl aminopeptidase/acylaminoacyl peptidase